jgi:DNA-binding PucR family transcriptional regulator
MASTLLVWLQTRGTHNEIAERLDVHPQTVRYRIHQLRRLFGDKLTDPDARLTMELALRAHMLLTPCP